MSESTVGIDAPGDSEAEVARVMQICNACRYCEGFCAVFPAMTRRIEFGKADAHYLANLCHNCGSCLHACQYAPPHEFVLNVPRAMARLRGKTYADYAWPSCMGAAYRHAGGSLVLALLASLLLFALLPAGQVFQPVARPGDFFALFPHGTLVWLFGAVFAFAALALGVGVGRFWREVSPGVPNVPAASETVQSILTLKYLDGGHGEGCNNEDDAFSLWRRNFHHLTFYGFLLCFAATLAATVYHYVLGIPAPYALSSVPVLLGTAGGIGLVVGPAGQLWSNLRRHPLHGDPAQRPLDRGFMVLLLLTSASGLALLACRDTVAMGVLLVVHLGAVMAFFLTLPYGKFAHGIYRSAALLKWAIEKRQASGLKLGSD
ncbi:MAG: tricarballylate utilization 4Fe-4S protein TcuB [Propionivibrio sp.]